jgi:microcystin-dependent protein
MAITYVDYTATGGQTDFDFTFPYLEDEHIKVEINGAETTDFTIVATPSTKVVLDSGATAGANVRVRRRSAPNQNLVDFVNGSVLTESELDLAYRHNRYLSEEIAELNDQSLQKESGGTEWDALGLRIQNVGTATDTTDAVTKLYLDNKVAQVSSGATQPPLKWVFSATSGTNNTYTVTGAEVLGDTAYEVSIDGLIKEPTVEYTVDPNTDTLTIIPNMTGGEDIVVIQRGFGVAVTGTVGTNSLVDGSVTNAKLASGAVTSDKISTTDTNFNVQSDGKVGIGTASPSKGIEIVNKQGILIRETQGIVDNQMPLISSSIADRLDHTDWGIAIKTVVENISNGYGIAFWTRNAYNGTFSEKLRINEHGYVGILNTTPQYPLDVTGDLNITGDYKVNGTNLTTVPTGTVSAFAGSSAPTGYLLCDGSLVNRTTYAALFAVIDETYGSGDGSTTFNLPDLRGRVVAGLGESLLGATADTLGEDNGLIADTKEHTLTEAEMPRHSHTANFQQGTGVSAFPGFDGSGDQYIAAQTGLTGDGAAHNNVQPTIILNYIIKT